MTTPLQRVGYLQTEQYTAVHDRDILAVPMARNNSGSYRDGVIWGPSKVLATTVTGGMNISTETGKAMIAGYTVSAASQTDLTVSAATSQARRDLVILRLYDSETGDVESKGIIELVKGAAGQSGVDPVVPPRSLILAQVNIAANASTVTITDRRTATAASGATFPVWGIDNQEVGSHARGQTVYDYDTDIVWRRIGNAWVRQGTSIKSGNSYAGRNNTVFEANTGSGEMVAFDFSANTTLVEPVSVVVVNALMNLTSLTAATITLKLYWGGTVYFNQAFTTNGGVNVDNNGDRAYSLFTVRGATAAGSYANSKVTIQCTAGGPVHVKNTQAWWYGLG